VAKSLTIGILVPAFNEEARVGEVLKELLAEVQAQEKATGHVIKVAVFDDGSTDNTANIVKAHDQVTLVSHQSNQGLGAAVRSGLTWAYSINADIAVKLDADGQHDPSDLAAVIAPIVANQADVVYGSRFGQIAYQMPFVRRLGNRIFSGLMKLLTGWPIQDAQPGFFAVSKAYLATFTIAKLRFTQVNIHFRKRVTGQSFISLRYPLKVLPQILIVIALYRPMKIFGTIGISTLFVGILWGFVELLFWLAGVTEKPVMRTNLVTILVIFGAQTLFFGVLAELVSQLFRSVQKLKNR
jgi:glycosyltransferase involved in cell wall biosynthesis